MGLVFFLSHSAVNQVMRGDKTDLKLRLLQQMTRARSWSVDVRIRSAAFVPLRHVYGSLVGLASTLLSLLNVVQSPPRLADCPKSPISAAVRRRPCRRNCRSFQLRFRFVCHQKYDTTILARF